MIAYSYIKVLSMSFDLSVPNFTPLSVQILRIIIFLEGVQVWEFQALFWDVFQIILVFYPEEDNPDWDSEAFQDSLDDFMGVNSTPFSIACENGDSEKVATLLKNGEHDDENDLLIAPCYTDNMLNITMIWACKHGDVEVVNILLNKGANFGSGIDYLMTPLQYACKYGHSDVVKVLLENGADVKYMVYSLRNGVLKTNTAMLLACENGHADVVNVLLDNGADVNENLKQSFYYDPVHDLSRFNTPLYISWMSKKKNVWKLLIERGANKDILW